MDGSPDALIASLSRHQQGVFSRRQAIELGIDPREVSRRRHSGRWRSLHPGVLADAGTPDSWQLRAMAALLFVGGDVVLARQSAARLWGLDLPPGVSTDLALLVENRTFPGLPDDITVHRTRRLPWRHVSRRAGFPVTTPARTIVDLAGQVGPVAIRRTIADAVRQRLTTADDLRTTTGHLGRVRGKRTVLRVCDELSPLEIECRSELESRFLRLMTRVGLPPTSMNHPVTDVHGRRRFLDAAYLPERLPVELDSRRHHGTEVDRHDDLDREHAITLVGWRSFRRFTWWDVHERPGHVVDTIREALAAARHDDAVERAPRGRVRP